MVDGHNDDSLNSIDDADYTDILPAVKVRQKRKKHSPGSASGHNSSMGMAGRMQSQSRMSTSGAKNNHKLRDTLD